MAELRWLRYAAAVEAASLLVLIVNLLTVHAGVVTSAGGPLHGFAWLATIALAFLAPLPRSARLLALVPGAGGLLAVRRASRDDSHHRSAAGPAGAGGDD